MKDEIISCDKMMMKIESIYSLDNANKVSSVWKRVVSRIKNYQDNDDNEKKMPIGERLAGNTRVVDLKKGILLVEADHPGWIQYLRMYQNFIIKGLNMEVPELKIKNLAFKMTGTQVSLNSNYDEELSKANKKMSEKIENTQRELEKVYPKEEKQNEKSPAENLPPEIREKFDSMLKSMLTNSEK